MIPDRSPLRILLMVVLLAGVVHGPIGIAAAQPGITSYTSVLSGSVIQTTSPWYVDLDATVIDPVSESIVLTTGLYGLVVAYLPPVNEPSTVRDMFLGQVFGEFSDVLTIDRGAYGAVSYSLDAATIDGVRMGVFTLFRGERASGFLEAAFYAAPITMFGIGIESLQQHVMIDDSPALTGIDGKALQALLNASEPGAPAASPVGETLGATPTAGDIRDGRYLSPQFGVEVTWGPEWVIDTLTGEALISGAADGYNGLMLDWTGGALVFAGVMVGEGSRADLESWLTAEDFGADSVNILVNERSGDASAAVFVVADADGFSMHGVGEMSCLTPACDTLVAVIVLGEPYALPAAYADAQASIAIDGVPVFTVLSPDEVSTALQQP